MAAVTDNCRAIDSTLSVATPVRFAAGRGYVLGERQYFDEDDNVVRTMVLVKVSRSGVRWVLKGDLSLISGQVSGKMPSTTDLEGLFETPVCIRYLNYDMESPRNLLGQYLRVPPTTKGFAYAAHVCARCLQVFPSHAWLTDHDGYCRLPGGLTTVGGQRVYEDQASGLRVHFLRGAEHTEYCRQLAALGGCFITEKDMTVDVTVAEFFVVTAAAHFFDPSAPLTQQVDERQQRDMGWDGFFAIAYAARIVQQPDRLFTTIAVLPLAAHLGVGQLLLQLMYRLGDHRVELCGNPSCCGQLPGRIDRPISDAMRRAMYGHYAHRALRFCEEVDFFKAKGATGTNAKDDPSASTGNHQLVRLLRQRRPCGWVPGGLQAALDRYHAEVNDRSAQPSPSQNATPTKRNGRKTKRGRGETPHAGLDCGDDVEPDPRAPVFYSLLSSSSSSSSSSSAWSTSPNRPRRSRSHGGAAKSDDRARLTIDIDDDVGSDDDGSDVSDDDDVMVVGRGERGRFYSANGLHEPSMDAMVGQRRATGPALLAEISVRLLGAHPDDGFDFLHEAQMAFTTTRRNGRRSSEDGGTAAAAAASGVVILDRTLLDAIAAGAPCEISLADAEKYNETRPPLFRLYDERCVRFGAYPPSAFHYGDRHTEVRKAEVEALEPFLPADVGP
jgi:hypothetical protein